MGKLYCITIDCADGESLAKFWAQALEGYRVDDEWKILIRSEAGPLVFFQKVPEPKSVKNRVHLDVRAADRPAEVRRLASLGASVVQEMDEGGHRWTIMGDPEGNEFCVVETTG